MWLLQWGVCVVDLGGHAWLPFTTTAAPVEEMVWADVVSAGVMASLVGLNGSGGGQCCPAGISRRVSNIYVVVLAERLCFCSTGLFPHGDLQHHLF